MGYPLISIIVPVYNTESYLRHCIESVLSQTYENWELLLINDGSTDSSGKICDNFASQDVRIKVFHKENGGVSSARNIGLDNAQGEWVTFLDSDDWMADEMCKEMLTAALQEEADIAYCDINMEYHGNGQTIWSAVQCGSDREKFLNDFIVSDWTPLWNLLAKKELFEMFDIRNPEGIAFCEDYYVAVRLMFYSRKISYIPKALYYYNRTNEDSVLHNLTSRHYENERWVNSETIDMFKHEGVYDAYARSLSWRLLKSKQEFVLDEKTYNDFLNFHPECHNYIWSCPYINIKIKIMMWALSMNMRCVAESFLFVRRLKQRISERINGRM